MVTLKYSVGIANKFGGLNLENDSSEDENSFTHADVLPASSPPLTLTNDSSLITDSLNTNEPSIDKRINEDESYQQTTNNKTFNFASRNKNKTKNGVLNSESTTPESDEKSLSRRLKSNNSDRTYNTKKQEKTYERNKPKKDFLPPRSNHISNDHSTSISSSDAKATNSSVKEAIVSDISKNEDKPIEASIAQKEKTSEAEESKKNIIENRTSDPVMMRLEEWKNQQAPKRVNNSTVTANKNNKPNLNKNLETQGFTRYVKFTDSSKNSEAQVDDYTNGTTATKKKPQTLNYFELRHNQSGPVKLFQWQKGRGRRNQSRNHNNIETTEKDKRIDFKERDAPDLQDLRAFPALGNAKVAT